MPLYKWEDIVMETGKRQQGKIQSKNPAGSRKRAAKRRRRVKARRITTDQTQKAMIRINNAQ